MFLNTQMMGMDLGFPDVLLVPPFEIPTPFPDVAMGPMAIPSQMTLMVMAMPAHNMGTMIPVTIGAPVGPGVASGTDMGPARHLTGAFTFLVDGMPATRMTSMSLQNSTNAPGVRLVPSQPTVLVLSP
jgi:hypothetical protein